MTSEGAGALLQVADALYALGTADFTAARDARAKELKRDDPGLAAQVKKLRKPSVAAWAVNLLVRREADQVAQVLQVGVALREAAANLSGEELRALTRQRRQLTAAVTTRARAVAAEAGQRLTPAVADQVEATLTAAILDEDCARAVRSGLLVVALEATGVGDTDAAAAVAVPEGLGFSASPQEAPPPEDQARPELHVVPDPEADQKALRAARERLEQAEAELSEATDELTSSSARVEELEARGLQLQGELDELRRRLADLEEQAEETDDELEEAEDARADAEGVVRDATAERDRAAEALARLEGG